MSPYAACKLINARLKADEVDKVLPPQMFYTYQKKKYIDFTSEESVIAWYEKKYLPMLRLRLIEV